MIINDFNDKELDIYARYSENQLVHIYEPETGLFIAESPKVISRALHSGYKPVSVLMEEGIPDSESKEVIAEIGKDIPVYTAPFDVLTKLTGYKLTRGMLCGMRRKKLASVEEIISRSKRIVVLEDVENPTNVGAIFRSAAALGMDGIILTHGCSDPLYRRCVRVSMGTVFQIPWTIADKNCSWPEDGIRLLKKHGFMTVSMALKEDSLPPDAPVLHNSDKLAVIMGNECFGLCKKTIELSDHTVMIPMTNGVDSLNVAAASAVAFWELGRDMTQ